MNATAAVWTNVWDELTDTEFLTGANEAGRDPARRANFAALLRDVMRGLKRDCSLRTVAAGHVFVQNVRRGHYELAVDVPVRDRMVVAWAELAAAI